MAQRRQPAVWEGRACSPSWGHWAPVHGHLAVAGLAWHREGRRRPVVDLQTREITGWKCIVHVNLEVPMGVKQMKQ